MYTRDRFFLGSEVPGKTNSFTGSYASNAIHELHLQAEQLWLRVDEGKPNVHLTNTDDDVTVISRLLKIDLRSGNVGFSVIVSNSQSGLSLRVIKSYFTADDVLMLANSDTQNRHFGVSTASQQDVALIRVNLSTGEATQSSV